MNWSRAGIRTVFVSGEALGDGEGAGKLNNACAVRSGSLTDECTNKVCSSSMTVLFQDRDFF